ncbi:MAG TPA: hypothetical protein VKA47_11385 [Solirubrobacterales bacterium]|nr:hypothetical protein [Solirubrobacterales bacterium]
MEASEKPQLRIEEPTGEGVVRALADRLVIESLTVADERAARLVRERAEVGQAGPETVTKAIEIGARVLDSEETAANVDYVRRELEAGLGELDRKLGGTLEEGADALAEQLAAAFGAERNDSVQGQIKEIVATATRQQRDELIGALTAEDGSNPLVAMQMRIGKRLVEAEERHRQELERLRESHGNEARATQGHVAELRKEIARLLEREDADERVLEAEEAGTRKGRSFEETVHAEIERIAEVQGDAARHVGDESSEAGGKKGDTVVELGGGLGGTLANLVFEAKNKRLSKNDAWSELNACMRERDATYAVLVVAGDDKIPAGLEELTEYQGNKIIAVLDRDDPDPLALRLVYRYVRARVLATRDSTLQVDASGVRDASEEAQAALKRANRVRKSLTGITNGAEAARTELNALIEDAEACLTRIDSLVAAAAQDAPD